MKNFSLPDIRLRGFLTILLLLRAHISDAVDVELRVHLGNESLCKHCTPASLTYVLHIKTKDVP